MILTQLDPPLSEGAHKVAEVLAELPLASAQDLIAVMRCKPATLYRRLKELRDASLGDSVKLGWTRERTDRLFFTDEGIAKSGRSPISWHDQGHRCRLLERFPSVEWFYPMVGSVEGMGQFKAFQWVEDKGLDAAAEFQDGWVALFWSGYLQSEEIIYERLVRLSQDISELMPTKELTWPGMLCYVVSDQWQRTLVNRVARYARLDEMVSVCCVADDSRTGIRTPLDSRGWIHQPTYRHDVGGWPWQKRVQDSLWSKKRGVGVSGVLDVVAQWPGITMSQTRKMLGEGQNGRGADAGMKALQKHKFVTRVKNDDKKHGSTDGQYHYSLAPKGIDCLVRGDRTKFSSYKRRGLANSWVEKPKLRDHEEGVISLMAQFADAEVPVTPGWRSWEHLGNRGIAPDGLVYLERTPLDSGWHYVEYERSARGRTRVEKKLAGYCSSNRQNRWPVMVTCWNDEVESRFHEVAESYNLSLLTSTIERLERYGPMNNGQCWQLFHVPVVVGLLSEEKGRAVSLRPSLVDRTGSPFIEGLAALPGTAS